MWANEWSTLLGEEKEVLAPFIWSVSGLAGDGRIESKMEKKKSEG